MVISDDDYLILSFGWESALVSLGKHWENEQNIPSSDSRGQSVIKMLFY